VVPVGFTLQPDREFLGLLDPLLREDVDYFEVAPETTWRFRDDGRIEPNGFHRAFLAMGETTRLPFVAHGVGLSLGGTAPEDAGRRARWLARIAEDQRAFRWRWYTDHLGVTAPGGLALTLPLAIPMTSALADAVRRSLRALRAVVPDVGFENTALCYVLGDALDEPRFFAKVLEEPGTHLLLDLHNLHTMAVNFGFEPERWLEEIDLGRVIEIHVSGGSASDPGWLPSGETMRLDSHDAPVPEEVWSLLERVAPRCPALRGVTLERMEGTVGPADVPGLREEVRRIRRTLAA
jgi:uncharacterized protein (UPF0276 family)